MDSVAGGVPLSGSENPRLHVEGRRLAGRQLDRRQEGPVAGLDRDAADRRLRAAGDLEIGGRALRPLVGAARRGRARRLSTGDRLPAPAWREAGPASPGGSTRGIPWRPRLASWRRQRERRPPFARVSLPPRAKGGRRSPLSTPRRQSRPPWRGPRRPRGLRGSGFAPRGAGRRSPCWIAGRARPRGAARRVGARRDRQFQISSGSETAVRPRHDQGRRPDLSDVDQAAARQAGDPRRAGADLSDRQRDAARRGVHPPRPGATAALLQAWPVDSQSAGANRRSWIHARRPGPSRATRRPGSQAGIGPDAGSYGPGAGRSGRDG